MATAFSASLSYNKQSDHTEVKPSITNNVVINPSTSEPNSVTITQSDGLNKIKLPPKHVKPKDFVSVSERSSEPITETIPERPVGLEPRSGEPVTEAIAEPSIPDTIVERGSFAPGNVIPVDDPINIFEHKLLRIVIGIFQQDMKLIKNIIEPSKDIVLTKTDLIDLIKTLTGEAEVEIMSSPPSSSCFGRVKFIDKIDRIVVGEGDFGIIYNTTYNRLKQYHIALDKCFVN